MQVMWQHYSTSSINSFREFEFSRPSLVSIFAVAALWVDTPVPAAYHLALEMYYPSLIRDPLLMEPKNFQDSLQNIEIFKNPLNSKCHYDGLP